MKQAVGNLRYATIAVLALLAGGCDRAVVLNPKGPIAEAERGLLIDAFTVMMLVIVPVIVMAFLFAWRYRAGRNARYEPYWDYSAKIDAVVWLIPALIVIALGVLVWRSTHKLDPYREIASSLPPLDIQVVAQDWKWLFIYPEQGVASVNQMAIPAGRPISLRITSDTVMNSFYVPALAGQIYAMAGMQTRLQMLANDPGKFVGRNSQYSGGGFSDQFFEVVATDPADFDAWVARARQSTDRLDQPTYARLAGKSRLNPVAYYSAVEPRLFESMAAGDLKAAPEVVLTKGTVSAVQNKERNTPMVLHSADISAGNSGGPLIDSCGRVVGINTYIVTSRQSTKANYALGSSWLAAFLRAARSPVDWRADACV